MRSFAFRSCGFAGGLSPITACPRYIATWPSFSRGMTMVLQFLQGATMDIALPFESMSVEEKLRILERIWEDLARTPATVPSPTWHRDVLEAREKRLSDGRERSIPWEQAKDDIRSTQP